MKTLITSLAFAAVASFSVTGQAAAADTYVLDASHSQVVFSYQHLGYSTTYGMFSGFEGEISYDEADPAASSVTVSMKEGDMLTGWEARFKHFMGGDFFGASEEEDISFTSTSIEITGETSADITGDLTLNGVTKSIVLDADLNQAGTHPQAQKPWLGFDATTTLLRSDFNLGAFAPFVSDEVEVLISIEAMKAE